MIENVYNSQGRSHYQPPVTRRQIIKAHFAIVSFVAAHPFSKIMSRPVMVLFQAIFQGLNLPGNAEKR